MSMPNNLEETSFHGLPHVCNSTPLTLWDADGALYPSRCAINGFRKLRKGDDPPFSFHISGSRDIDPDS